MEGFLMAYQFNIPSNTDMLNLRNDIKISSRNSNECKEI